MVKAIIFDMGGVLVDLDLQACHNAFREKAGFGRIAEFIDPCHQRGFVGEMEAGRISEEEFYRQCIPYCAPGTSPEIIESCFSALLVRIEPYKVGLLKELAARYPLYMLSNNNPISTRRCRQLFAESGIPVETIFRETFMSFEMKLLKPGLEIYLEAARRTGLPAGDLLFIDDSPSNVEAARAAGMQSFLYVQGTDLRAALEEALSK